jgi:hypothetical protein
VLVPVLVPMLVVPLLLMLAALLMTRLAGAKEAGAGCNPDANEHGRCLDDVQADGTQHVHLLLSLAAPSWTRAAATMFCKHRASGILR